MDLEKREVQRVRLHGVRKAEGLMLLGNEMFHAASRR
jgi:hypothetical protein